MFFHGYFPLAEILLEFFIVRVEVRVVHQFKQTSPRVRKLREECLELFEQHPDPRNRRRFKHLPEVSIFKYDVSDLRTKRT